MASEESSTHMWGLVPSLLHVALSWDHRDPLFLFIFCCQTQHMLVVVTVLIEAFSCMHSLAAAMLVCVDVANARVWSIAADCF
jgi:hypothetical protein